MKASLKSEFRKFLSVRSTYFITGFVLIFVLFIAFYVIGWRMNNLDLHNTGQLASDVTGALNLTVFGAIAAVLLVTHEYRYNTIVYTLTNSNSRTKVLLSKFIVISVYAVFLSLLIGVLSPIVVELGVHANGHTLVPQILNYWNLAWRSVFYGWGYGMAGLILALLTRNQVASIAALFVIPDLAEKLLGLLLKHNTVYLPFSALNQVIRSGASNMPTSSNLSPLKAAGVFCIYLVVGLTVSWLLFIKRDAT